MASNHVQPGQNNMQNGHLFGDGRDGVNYNNIYSHGQPFPNNQHNDYQNPTGAPSHSPYNSVSAFRPPTWQNTATGASSPPAQNNTYIGGGNNSNFFTPSSTTSGNLYTQNPHYGQNVDPSLFRQPDPRSYGQQKGTASSASPAATIAPSNLQQGTSLARQAVSPGLAMQNVFSQNMGNQQRDAGRFPTAQTPVYSQDIKVPKGVQSGNFIIVNFDDLSKATQSKKLGEFANIRQQPVELNLTRVNVPAYVPRKSQNDLKALAANDPSLRAKIVKRQKKTKSFMRRVTSPGKTIELSSGSESSDYSDSDSDSDASPPPEPSPLPAVRPQKAVEIVRYDTIKATWFPRNKFVENDKILKGLGDLWEVVRTIRDRWKSDREAVKKAEAAKQQGEIPLLRERVDKQLEMMEAVLEAAVRHGHPDLLSACGQHLPLMAACYSLMLEPVRDGNYTGSLIKAIYKFLSLCTNLNGDIAEKASLTKLLTRSAKRGSEEIKKLTAKINENISASNKKSKTASVKALDKDSPKPADSPKTVKQEVNTVAGVKRPRPAEGTSAQPAKRVASGSSAPVSKDNAAAKLGLVKKAGAPAPAAAAKPKPVAKPATGGFFAGLQSASKKPGTSNAALAAKKATTATTAEKKGPAPAAPMARPAFSFAETMANLSKEKEKEPPKKTKEEDKRPPETEEQKAKRLRKEARRSLRVHWKPDATLVAIKEFSRDPSEMPNRITARDVRDGGKEKEGLTLKQHIDMMDVDEDDDQPMEQTFFEIDEVSNIDWSTVPHDERQRNFERFGGGMQKTNSPERSAMDNREATTLIAHYSSKADVPPNPKEPADPYNGPEYQHKDFGYPDAAVTPWLTKRLARYDTAPAAPPPTDITALLATLTGAAQQAQPPQQPQQPAPTPAAPMVNMSALESILANVKSSAAAPAAQPAQQSYQWPQMAPQAAPESNPQHQQAPASATDILAQLSANPALAHLGIGVSAPPQQQHAPQATAPAAQPDPQLSAWMAALAQQSNSAAGTAPSMTNYAAYGQGQDQAQQNNYYGGYNPQTYGNNDANNSNQQDGGYGRDAGKGANNNKKHKGEWNGNPSKKYLFPCRFFKDGKCKKGDSCTYRHDYD